MTATAPENNMFFNLEGPWNLANKVLVELRVWSIYAIMQNTRFLIIEHNFMLENKINPDQWN